MPPIAMHISNKSLIGVIGDRQGNEKSHLIDRDPEVLGEHNSCIGFTIQRDL
jgi:hypothetical protein